MVGEVPDPNSRREEFLSRNLPEGFEDMDVVTKLQNLDALAEACVDMWQRGERINLYRHGTGCLQGAGVPAEDIPAIPQDLVEADIYKLWGGRPQDAAHTVLARITRGYDGIRGLEGSWAEISTNQLYTRDIAQVYKREEGEIRGRIQVTDIIAGGLQNNLPRGKAFLEIMCDYRHGRYIVPASESELYDSVRETHPQATSHNP